MIELKKVVVHAQLKYVFQSYKQEIKVSFDPLITKVVCLSAHYLTTLPVNFSDTERIKVTVVYSAIFHRAKMSSSISD